MTFKAFKEAGEPYLYWWSRIRGAPIDYSYSTLMELYRKYDIGTSTEKSRRLLVGHIARLSMLKNNDISSKPFVEDMADVLCVVNDNDIRYRFEVDEIALSHHIDEDGSPNFYGLDPRGYADIRKRKGRQLRGILKKQNKNNSPSVEVVGGKEEK